MRPSLGASLITGGLIISIMRDRPRHRRFGNHRERLGSQRADEYGVDELADAISTAP